MPGEALNNCVAIASGHQLILTNTIVPLGAWGG